jgi:putative spermidine/putrescine transport system ATP-binding protein
VGVSNVLERDGRRFTVRPEKIRILEEGESADGYRVEAGTVEGVNYAGMITRLRVELDAGGELQVVTQNLETTSQDALEQQGRKVRLGWREEHTYAIDDTKEEGS